VSMSRRGLIAVGLAVAVVGTMGVVSTVNAGAAETPIAPSPVAAPDTDVATDPAQLPPPLLPWGAKPKPIIEGEPGDSSQELTESGASAVDVAAEPEAGFEPKGESLKRGVLRTSETDVPPRPPIAAEPVNGQSQVDYFYAVGKQTAAPAGVAALLKVSQPAVSTQDWHSLAEIALQSADSHQVVEVGWIVNSGDNSTHLFVYHWVNGAPTCYNACGFVPYAGASIAPGAALAVDVSKQFGIQHYNGAWWIAYDTEWIGSFPDSLWSGAYTQTGLVQVFGEVAASSTNPCTQMGNGLTPGDTSAAKISSVTYVDGPPVVLTVSTTSTLYPAVQTSDRTFRFGGIGTC